MREDHRRPHSHLDTPPRSTPQRSGWTPREIRPPLRPNTARGPRSALRRECPFGGGPVKRARGRRRRKSGGLRRTGTSVPTVRMVRVSPRRTISASGLPRQWPGHHVARWYVAVHGLVGHRRAPRRRGCVRVSTVGLALVLPVFNRRLVATPDYASVCAKAGGRAPRPSSASG